MTCGHRAPSQLMFAEPLGSQQACACFAGTEAEKQAAHAPARGCSVSTEAPTHPYEDLSDQRVQHSKSSCCSPDAPGCRLPLKSPSDFQHTTREVAHNQEGFREQNCRFSAALPSAAEPGGTAKTPQGWATWAPAGQPQGQHAAGHAPAGPGLGESC